jgi:hypothetical protein
MLRWDEVWGVTSAVWSLGQECSLECQVWSVKNVRSVDPEVWSVDCWLWSLEWEEWSVDFDVWSVKCGVLSEVLTAKGAVWRVQCEECRGKCVVWKLLSVKCEAELEI